MQCRRERRLRSWLVPLAPEVVQAKASECRVRVNGISSVAGFITLATAGQTPQLATLQWHVASRGSRGLSAVMPHHLLQLPGSKFTLHNKEYKAQVHRWATAALLPAVHWSAAEVPSLANGRRQLSCLHTYPTQYCATPADTKTTRVTLKAM